ncbi:hypothetical protein ABW20_dc0106328 [Dactylellina cionopaga]|nr:hypothetical protein ABW20_dc0106328 [Dactylellina cionopaga]
MFTRKQDAYSPEASRTYTNTRTTSTTSTSTEYATKTNTIHATATETATQTIVSTINVPGSTVPVVGPYTLQTVQKRVVTESSTYSFPRYATACSGSVRFSSACSCIGVSKAPPRSTTVTVPSTLTYTAVTTVTTATTSITTTDATTTVTTAVTQTTTIPVVATQTLVPFLIKATYQSSGAQVYLKSKTFRGFQAIGFTTDITQATVFGLFGTQLIATGGLHATVNNESYSYVFMQPANTPTGYSDMSCSVDSSSNLVCFRGAANVIGEVGGDGVLGIATPDFASGNAAFMPLSFKATF